MTKQWQLQSLLTFLIVVILSIQNCHSQPTDFKSRSGHNYDYCELEKAPYWTVKQEEADSGIFKIAYVFNFGDSASKLNCEGTVGPYEALEVMGQLTDSCELLGRSDSMRALELPDSSGIRLTYSNGETCSVSEATSDVGKPKSISFKVLCSAQPDDDWIVSPVNGESITSCNVELQINHPAGCYIGHFKRFSILKTLFWIIILAMLYFGGRYLYNVRVLGMSGLEAVPHSEYLHDFPGLAQTGLAEASANLKQNLRQIAWHFKRRQREGTQEYENL